MWTISVRTSALETAEDARYTEGANEWQVVFLGEEGTA